MRERVAFLRKVWGLEYTELARQLAAVGRPIPVSGLRRIEAGERRVDVDDLVALSQVLTGTHTSEWLLRGTMTLSPGTDGTPAIVWEDDVPDVELLRADE